MARVGLMLYSVRDECARDFEGTLRAVAELGYEGVELFDLYGHDAGDVRAMLDGCRLEVAGCHTMREDVETRLPELAAQCGARGTARLGVGWTDPSAYADAQALVDRFARGAERAAALGLELGFHNHDAEVVPLDDGRTFLDRLLELPVFLEVDLGWAWWAGVDPVELLERTRGRVPLVHVKDFPERGVRSFCPVGDGGVGYEVVAPAAVAAGVDWLLVEQDEADGSTLEAARRSLEALRGMLVPA